MKTSLNTKEKIYDEKILNEIKKDYINGETKTLLYKKYGLKYKIDKFSFLKIINNINKELGFHPKNKIENDTWKINSQMQMNLKSEYVNSTYIDK